MKKIFLAIILFCLLIGGLAPFLTEAALVTCDPAKGKPCGIGEFFGMLGGIYAFIVKDIATPLAVIAIIVGGILMMISAGNPNLLSLGKKILYSAIIGLVLAYCAYLIIDTILKAAGFPGGLSGINVN